MADESLTRLRVGGVPEHFNLPWHLACESGQFTRSGLDVSWRDCPGGTGEMCQLLQEGELDLIVALTEGAISAIDKHKAMRIVQWYVRSPLIWGVHARPDSSHRCIDDLRGKRFAISRPGSGSHLMAAVMAQQHHWPSDSLEFVTVGNLQGAVEAFANRQADGFLWERYTTQPLVERGAMRRIDECPTPWPAFVLCASRESLADHAGAINTLQGIIQEQCAALKGLTDLTELIAQRYQLRHEQVAHWLARTRWACDGEISADELEPVIASLGSIQQVSSSLTGSDCLAGID